MASLPPSAQTTRGIALRVVMALCWAGMGALLKLGATRGAGVVELVLYRALFGLPVVLAWVLASQGLDKLAVQRPMAHVWRSAIGISTMFCVFGALTLLPLAEATSLLFTGPIFATLLSWLLLKERVGRHRLAAGVAAFAGVVVIMRPGEAAESIAAFGVLIGLTAAFGQASVTVTLRHLGGTEHVAAIVFWFLVACTAVGLTLLPVLGRPIDGTTLLILAAAGAVGGLGQICMTGSLQAAPIALLAPFDYLHLVGAMALGWLMLGAEPTFNTFAGAALIAGSGLYTWWREQRLRRRREVPATQPVG